MLDAKNKFRYFIRPKLKPRNDALNYDRNILMESSTAQRKDGWIVANNTKEEHGYSLNPALKKLCVIRRGQIEP
jgi:hypothetical protein